MRIVLLAAPAALALALAACASDMGPNRDQSELARLAEECRARGGILVTSKAELTGRPAADNICQIHGPATRIEPRAR
ncbi:hypothetical protein [Brevundimonas sp.]|uniref:hypothetical protein n=1 Tax=Brevundimonas sp. TaxID=1871086 RepID=UPI002D37BEA9|nr:hypothetical protein [Brevundimonas sp.]HYC97152.1 hypothetical protein [Brevundimonas sp.]